MRGLLITFEGIDASGKSTQAKKLYEFLNARGYPANLYRDPGSTPLAESIRNLILSNQTDPITELLLFEAARSSLVWERVFPDLKQGTIVILDRFTDSTVAYQGYGRELNLGTVDILNHIATRGKKPDITFILNVSLETALERLKQKENTRFEKREFLRKVRDAFILLFHQQKDNRKIFLIDAERSVEEVFEEIKSITLRFLDEV